MFIPVQCIHVHYTHNIFKQVQRPTGVLCSVMWWLRWPTSVDARPLSGLRSRSAARWQQTECWVKRVWGGGGHAEVKCDDVWSPCDGLTVGNSMFFLKAPCVSLFMPATVNILKEEKNNNWENSEAERVGSDFDRGAAEGGWQTWALSLQMAGSLCRWCFWTLLDDQCVVRGEPKVFVVIYYPPYRYVIHVDGMMSGVGSLTVCVGNKNPVS